MPELKAGEIATAIKAPSNHRINMAPVQSIAAIDDFRAAITDTPIGILFIIEEKAWNPAPMPSRPHAGRISAGVEYARRIFRQSVHAQAINSR